MTDRPGDGAEQNTDPPPLVEPPPHERVVPPRADAPPPPPADPDARGRSGEAGASGGSGDADDADPLDVPTQPADLAELTAEAAPAPPHPPADRDRAEAPDAAGAEADPNPDSALESDSWLAWPPGMPSVENEPAGTPAGVDALFADDRFRDYEDPPLPTRREQREQEDAEAARRADDPALASLSPFGMPPDEAPGAVPVRAVPGNPLVWVVVALVALLALIALYLVGTRVPSIVAGDEPSPTASATTGPPAAPTRTAEPGEHDWTELAGGECLQPFDSAFAQTFTVVPCTTPHAAQLVLRAPVTGAGSTEYPGTTALQQSTPAVCQAAGVVDLGVGSRYTDLQLSTAYPATIEQWEAGQRDAFCFVTRSSAKTLTRSIVGDAQQKVWASRGSARSGPSATPRSGG